MSIRYLTIRRITSRDVIGIIKVPNGSYVNTVYRYPFFSIFLESVSETEYTSYEAFDLFPEFRAVIIGKFVAAYDPRFFYEDGGSISKKVCLEKSL